MSMYSRDPVIPLVNNYNILTIKNKIHKVAETYMNDTELILALDRGMIQDLGVEMQAVAQYWEHLLYTTGGAALALEKFFFVAIDWNFNQDEYSLKTQKEMDLAIHLTSGEAGGTPTSVPHTEAAMSRHGSTHPRHQPGTHRLRVTNLPAHVA